MTMNDINTEFIKAEALAAFTAHAINQLLTSESLDLAACCFHCSAPYKALWELTSTTLVSDVVRPYVARTGGDWDWWAGNAFAGTVKLGVVLNHLIQAASLCDTPHSRVNRVV